MPVLLLVTCTHPGGSCSTLASAGVATATAAGAEAAAASTGAGAGAGEAARGETQSSTVRWGVISPSERTDPPAGAYELLLITCGG